MKTLWITYAWDDNKSNDIDFIAQELIEYGINIKLDKWNIQAGKRLWEQIDKFITDPKESDGWMIVATQNSLGSEPCKEEFAIALDRVLKTRGGNFPFIGLFISPADSSLIPTSLKIRLYVSITDPDWKERIKATLEGVELNISKPIIDPYTINVKNYNDRFAIEIRPRAGTWAPFFVALPIIEKDSLDPYIKYGPTNNIPAAIGSLVDYSLGKGPSTDKNWYLMTGGNEATPTMSYYLFCKQLPSEISFGIFNGTTQYNVRLNK